MKIQALDLICRGGKIFIVTPKTEDTEKLKAGNVIQCFDNDIIVDGGIQQSHAATWIPVRACDLFNVLQNLTTEEK